jgi:uncharacterized membrane protein (Fun14 family)
MADSSDLSHPLPSSQAHRGSLALAAGLFTLDAAAQPGPPSPPGYAPPGAEGGSLFSELFFLKLGFSFMVGLAMGYALKIAFKIALLVIGLILLAVFGLQFAGIVDVNWTGLEAHYDSWTDWLGAAAGVFFGFVGENLTSAASFLAGLAVGLRL